MPVVTVDVHERTHRIGTHPRSSSGPVGLRGSDIPSRGHVRVLRVAGLVLLSTSRSPDEGPPRHDGGSDFSTSPRQPRVSSHPSGPTAVVLGGSSAWYRTLTSCRSSQEPLVYQGGERGLHVWSFTSGSTLSLDPRSPFRRRERRRSPLLSPLKSRRRLCRFAGRLDDRRVGTDRRGIGREGPASSAGNYECRRTAQSPLGGDVRAPARVCDDQTLGVFPVHV